MNALTAPAPSRKVGTFLTIAIGFVAGLIFGVIGSATAVGWALFAAADAHASRSVPLLIQVRFVDGSLQAESGDGLLVPALVVGVLGAIVGLVIRLVRRSR